MGVAAQVGANSTDEAVVSEEERLHGAAREEAHSRGDGRDRIRVVSDEAATEDDVPHLRLLRREARDLPYVVAHHAQQRERDVVCVVRPAHGGGGGARLGEAHDAEGLADLIHTRQREDGEDHEPEALLVVSEQRGDVAHEEHWPARLILLTTHGDLAEGRGDHVAAQSDVPRAVVAVDIGDEHVDLGARASLGQSDDLVEGRARREQADEPPKGRAAEAGATNAPVPRPGRAAAITHLDDRDARADAHVEEVARRRGDGAIERALGLSARRGEGRGVSQRDGEDLARHARH